jgi:hypothetical protein
MHPPFMFGFFKQEVVGALRNLSFNYLNCGEALTTIGWVEVLVSSYHWNGMLGFPFKQPIGICFVLIIPSLVCKYIWLTWTYVSYIEIVHSMP